MPTGYYSQGKTYSKRLHRWIDKETTSAFDYDAVDGESAAFLISFFRYYPDIMADIFRSPNAQYGLEFPQRLMMRALARYRNTYITGVRGLTKTYVLLLTKMEIGILYPGEIMRYCAPNQKQAAALATQAFHQIEKDYPDIAQMWHVRNDRQDMFRITTRYGSEFSMYAPRGSNAHQSIAEEIGAEGPDGFDMATYENDVLPTVRLVRTINQKKDPTHINQMHAHITNACSRQNRAYTVHRYKALHDMLYGDKYEGFVLDIPWEVALICNIRDQNYIKDQKSKLSVEGFLREMCAIYTGTNDNPIVSDEVLAKSRKLMAMEDRHCGSKEVIYIVSHDVSYEDGTRNAKCGDVVLKLSRYTNRDKREKYKKQVVWADAYPPPKTAYLQALKTRQLWQKFCNNSAQTTYLVIDARAYGKDVIEELMKPSEDGTPPLCCYRHMRYTEIEQPGALPVIYPLIATNSRGGGADDEGEMIRYAQIEFEQGNIELLTSTLQDGVEQYKRRHNIKDNTSDSRIVIPYKRTDELCSQISNLVMKTTGTSLRETRKSKSVPRDIWSALKYALRVAALLEKELVKETYQKKSSWADEIAKYAGRVHIGPFVAESNSINHQGDARSRLIGLRHR